MNIVARVERNVTPVGRPTRTARTWNVRRHVPRMLAIAIGDPNVAVTVSRRGEGDLRAVRRVLNIGIDLAGRNEFARARRVADLRAPDIHVANLLPRRQAVGVAR